MFVLHSVKIFNASEVSDPSAILLPTTCLSANKLLGFLMIVLA